MAITGNGKARLLADKLGGRITVHHRHLAIHQDAVEVGVLRQQVERLLAVDRQAEGYARLLQQLAGQLSVQFVVFHQQQAGTTQAGRGAGIQF